MVAIVVIDHHILDALTIMGLLTGALGSLYLAYEYCRPHMLLQRLTVTSAAVVAFVLLMLPIFAIFNRLESV